MKLRKTSPEPLLICATEVGDNEKRSTREERGEGPVQTWRLESSPLPAAPHPGGRRDRRKTEAHEQGHAPPFQSAAAVSHGSRASGGEAPS